MNDATQLVAAALCAMSLCFKFKWLKNPPRVAPKKEHEQERRRTRPADAPPTP